MPFAEYAILLFVLNLHEPGEVNYRLRMQTVELPRKHKRDERLHTVLFDWVQQI